MNWSGPRRNGAFVNHGHHVVFTTGKDEKSAVVLLNPRMPSRSRWSSRSGSRKAPGPSPRRSP